MKYYIGKKSDFQEKVGKELEVEGRAIAVFRIGDKFYAIKNICPHKGWKLHPGYVNENTKSVKCPGHSWEFSLESGAYLTNPNIKVRTFSIIVEGDEVFIEI
jgi:NAD(P)H-dependent nitrite reductase small subunit